MKLDKVKSLITFGIFAAVYGLYFIGASFEWGIAVKILKSFKAVWWLYIIGFSTVVCLLRRYVLGLPPRLIGVAIIYLLTFLIVFCTQLVPYGAKPTPLLIWTYLNGMAIFNLFMLDLILRPLVLNSRDTSVKRTMIIFVISLMAVVALMVFLKASVNSIIFNFIIKHVFIVLLLLPLIAGYFRKKYFNRRYDYVIGLSIAFVSVFGWLSIFPDWKKIIVLLVYIAGWMHVYYEDLYSLILKLKNKFLPAKPKGGKDKSQALTSGSRIKKIFAKVKLPAGKEMMVFLVGLIKRFYKPVMAILILAALILAAIPVGKKIYRKYFIAIAEFTPQGCVSDRISIRITFSEPVEIKDEEIGQLDCFKIEPALPGKYRQATEKTITFIPAEKLKPATRYQVSFDPGKLKGLTDKRISSRARIEFHTKPFQVENAKVNYTLDQITGEKTGVAGHISFNYPIEIDELKKHSAILINGQPGDFEFEAGFNARVVYFKSETIKPKEKKQIVKLKIVKAMTCINGTDSLSKDVVIDMSLAPKPKLAVEQVKLWHEPGTTLISVLFNMPITQAEVERSVSLTPAIDVKVETEYAYAVLRGDFKPNTKYEVKVRAGMRSRLQGKLERDYKKTINITDLPAQVQFVRPGNILSLKGPKVLGVKTINLDQINVKIHKVFQNNLLGFLKNQEYHSDFRHVYEGPIDIEGGQINEELNQYINLSKFQSEPYKGLFRIELSDPEKYYYSDSAWFLCTDLGLIAKQSGDDLIIYVLSIENLAPYPGAGVELISKDNQVMDRQITNALGKIVFVNWKKHEYNLSPFYVVAKTGNDFSFMQFNNTELNKYQFSVGGDSHNRDKIDAFITPERGVYRPGEKADITGIVRNSNNSIPPDIPVELVVTDPRGSEYQRATGRYNANGVVSFEIDFPLYALTGQYYLVLKQKNKEIGKTSLKVEEFIPDKLKVKVKVSRKRVAANEALEFEVQARQMFGPPAAHNKVVTKVVFYSRIFSHPKYKKYTFADHTRSFWDEEVELGEEQLDEQGKNPYYVEIPGLTPPSALKAYIYTEVFDSGGRPVSAVGFADIDLYTHYLGVKRKGQGPMFEKKGIKLNYVAIDAQGRKQKVRKVRLIIKRKAWYSIFRHGSWGHSSYDSASYEELITNKVIDIKGKGEFEFIPKAAGEYQVLLISPNGMQTRITLDVMGTGYATTNLESPENLKISLDKKKYAVGEQAQVLVHAPFPGKLFLTIEREKVYQTRIIPITGRKAAVSIPITGEYLPNMYVVGLLVRTPDEKMQTLPMVSYGIEPLYVKTASKQIRFEWDVAKTSKAQEGIDVSLQVGSRPGGTNVILAAVDEGALQITNFKTPDPLKYFYRKRSLDTRAYTFFKLILPNLFKRKFAIGGGEGDITRRHLNPVTAKKKKTLALYSGILTPDSNGRIQYHFDTPEFNGEVRVMAMAVQGDYYGSDARAIQVFDPIVLQPNYPPFLAPQDQFQIPIQIFNKTGKKTKITLRISAEGPITITDKSPVREFVLGKEKQKRVIYQARANNNAGVGKVKIVAQGAGHEIFRKREISIRPYNTLKTVVKHGTLKPEAAVDIQVPAGFIPFGQRIRFGISSNPLFKYMRSLEYLIQYPYGCAEQIASKVFPLIYFKELGFATGRFSGQANAVDVFIRVGIDKLEKLQLADGNFAMWPGGSAAGKWLNMYISHFLIEADNMGYAVKAKVLKRIKQNVLKGKLTHKKLGRLDRRDHVPEKQEAVDAYLLYLRALLNEPDVEGMVFLLNKKLDKLGEFDRAMLSMCYSRIGDQQTALKVLKPDFKSKFIYREQYGAFNSTVRNTAMYLSALALAKPDSKRIPKLINYLGSKMKDGHFGSTQENVWAFMALGRVYGVKSKIVKTDIWVDDQPYKMLAGQDLIHTDNQLSGKKITLKNLSQQKSFYYFLAEGTPLEKVAQTTSNGMKISRSFYNSSGKSVNLTNVPQGELVAVTIKVTADKEAVRNVIVVELLPGGFEIENPRLSSRGELGFDPRQSMAYDYQDIRDDRILLFVNQLAGTKCYSYTVRAVTPGRYVIPNAYAEAMYDPDINAEYYEPKFLVISDNNPGE